MSFSDVDNTLASGYLEVFAIVYNDSVNGGSQNTGSNDTTNVYYEFPVFDSFENTKAVLAKQGIDINAKVGKEDILSITVYNYIDDTEPVEITDTDQMEEILDNVYARSQAYFSAVDSTVSNDYDVDILIKPEKYNGYYAVNCGFKNGYVPDFTKQN